MFRRHRQERIMRNDHARWLAQQEGFTDLCKGCGAGFNQVRRRGRPKRYCSDECRQIAERKSNLIAKRYGQAKCRAARDGREWDLTLEDLHDRLGDRCEQTGLIFDFSDYKDDSGCNPRTPSLDRRDSNKGYTLDNIQWVVWEYNQFKRNKTDAQALESIQRMADAIRREP